MPRQGLRGDRRPGDQSQQAVLSGTGQQFLIGMDRECIQGGGINRAHGLGIVKIPNPQVSIRRGAEDLLGFGENRDRGDGFG